MPTIDDVIRVSGISRSTVNRFLAGKKIRHDNEIKIKAAMREIGYRPDKLDSKRDCVIEIIGSSGSSRASGFHGFSEMLMSMVEKLEEGGATIQIHSGGSPYIPAADGVIMYGLAPAREDALAEILRKKGIPFVYAYREIEQRGVSYVTCDNYSAAYEMTQHFINHGHTKIAVCGGSNEKRNMPEKLQGFKDCMRDNGLPVDGDLLCESNSGVIAREWIHNLLRSGKEFTALFGLRDYLAIVFAEIAAEYGKKVPEDIVTAGMDGSIETVYARPKLTSVAIPYREIGTEAAKAIFELIDNKNTVSVRKILKHKIIFRESFTI